MPDRSRFPPVSFAAAAAGAATGAPPRRRRRRKPKAQFVQFKGDIYTTAMRVPRETNGIVARFQDVLWRLEPALQTRPNVASTAGWLLREGVRFTSRNRVHGLGREPAAKADDNFVQLGIFVDRRTWAELQRWVVAENTMLETVVPRLIELGAEQRAPLAPPPAPR